VSTYLFLEAPRLAKVSVEVAIVNNEVVLTVFSGGAMTSLSMNASEAKRIAGALRDAANDLPPP